MIWGGVEYMWYVVGYGGMMMCGDEGMWGDVM